MFFFVLRDLITRYHCSGTRSMHNHSQNLPQVPTSKILFIQYAQSLPIDYAHFIMSLSSKYIAEKNLPLLQLAGW